jgi:hypothetical protein
MNKLLQQKFFRLLSEYSQRKVSASELIEAINEYKITPILWSQKNNYKEELAA